MKVRRLLFGSVAALLVQNVKSFSVSASRRSLQLSTQLHADASTSYEQGSFMVTEFSDYDELQDVVELSSQPLPERPDGIVCVAKYTSAFREDCRATEAEYERMARANPATVFLRCYAEYENAEILLARADISVWPTFDVFYQGRRVGRVEGNSLTELEELVDMFQLQNSKLDLFSEDANNSQRLAWGDGKISKATKTPRTTNRFILGYDWDKDSSFFDDTAQKFEDDFKKMFGDSPPNVED